MRMSNLFGMTLREEPAEAEVTSHQLLLRGGYIRQTGAGIFSYLHFAKRSMTKLENIMREEMNAIGGQEICMPVVHQADIWKETNRYFEIGAEMGRFQDRNERDMVLAMTHEEIVADLIRREIQSYKQLPRLVYHIQTKWRDDPRPRAGLIRVREFTMKDSYSLDRDWEGLDEQYRRHYQAYFNIFRRSGIDVISVKSVVGMMGGKLAHEFMYLTPVGEDTLLLCDGCGYTANRQIATFQKYPGEHEEPAEIEKVYTPDMKTIVDLAEFLKIPGSKTAKVVFMLATITEGEVDVEKLVFAVVRGDMDLNETKLTNAIKAKALRPAVDEEIEAVGAVPGFASPMAIRGALVVVDDLIPLSPNLTSGANEKDYHYMNVNYGRDYEADIVTDLVSAREGYACPDCGVSLRESRGVEVGNIFKLGTRYTEGLGCYFQDREGKEKPVIMGSYGIGVGRLLACIAEDHNDEYGLIMPITVTPYQVYLVSLKGAEEQAEALYEALKVEGIEVLFDDRDERPGVKFNDADLIGIPIRVTVSERTLSEDSIEFKLRREKDKQLVPMSEAVIKIKSSIQMLMDEIKATVVEVTYDE